MVFAKGSVVKHPEVSVCIPVYNTEAYIGEAIRSTLSQTFRDFELIVLDNKSTDNTLKVVGKFNDKRMRVVKHKKNLGAEANWNAALREARGEFIKILCADDFMYPDCLEKQTAALRSNKGAVLVCAARDIVNEAGRRIMKRGPASEMIEDGLAAVRRTIRHGTNIFGETSSALFRADAQKRTGPFDASIPYVIDLDMWARLLLRGSVVFLSEATSAYRVAPSSWSAEIITKQRENFVRFIQRIRANPAYKLSPLDAAIGQALAFLQSWLRQLFYRFVLGWKRA